MWVNLMVAMMVAMTAAMMGNLKVDVLDLWTAGWKVGRMAQRLVVPTASWMVAEKEPTTVVGLAG